MLIDLQAGAVVQRSGRAALTGNDQVKGYQKSDMAASRRWVLLVH